MPPVTAVVAWHTARRVAGPGVRDAARGRRAGGTRGEQCPSPQCPRGGRVRVQGAAVQLGHEVRGVPAVAQDPQPALGRRGQCQRPGAHRRHDTELRHSDDVFHGGRPVQHLRQPLKGVQQGHARGARHTRHTPDDGLLPGRGRRFGAEHRHQHGQAPGRDRGTAGVETGQQDGQPVTDPGELPAVRVEVVTAVLGAQHGQRTETAPFRLQGNGGDGVGVGERPALRFGGRIRFGQERHTLPGQGACGGVGRVQLHPAGKREHGRRAAADHGGAQFAAVGGQQVHGRGEGVQTVSGLVHGTVQHRRQLVAEHSGGLGPPAVQEPGV